MSRVKSTPQTGADAGANASVDASSANASVTSDTNANESSSGDAADLAPRITTLANGLSIVTQNMAHLETVSLGIWVSCGARHEAPEDNGISHFLEHMAFKGTAKRSAREIVEEIEQVGGDLNAATSLETTAYYARVLKGDVPLALDLLADILNNPSYEAEEIERERDVILQEIAATKDSPEELAYDLVQEMAYKDQAIGRPILGTAERVKGFRVADLRRFLADHYTPGRMVISAAGAVDHGAIVAQAQKLFGNLKSAGAEQFAPALYNGAIGCLDRSFEQSHMMMAFKAPSYMSPEFFAAQVFTGLFGGGMSSRLFQEVREKRGLCYSIYSSCWALRDAGVFSINAATGPEQIDELVRVVADQLSLAACKLPDEREVERAKAQMKAGLMMSLESSAVRAEQMARHLMAYGRVRSTSELIDEIDGVSARQVQKIAQGLLRDAPPSLAIVGPEARRMDLDFAAPKG